MKSILDNVVVGLVADTLELQHQHDATRGLILALTRAAVRNGSISGSEILEALHQTSVYLAATNRPEAGKLMMAASEDLRTFCCEGERHTIPGLRAEVPDTACADEGAEAKRPLIRFQEETGEGQQTLLSGG